MSVSRHQILTILTIFIDRMKIKHLSTLRFISPFFVDIILNNQLNHFMDMLNLYGPLKITTFMSYTIASVDCILCTETPKPRSKYFPNQI